MARIKSFNRRELKFIIRTDQMQPFIDDITPFLNRDSYTNQADTYRITSLYYDTSQYMAYRQKIEGLKHRRKLRIRIYGEGLVEPEDECFVEIKERIDQSVRKRRIIIPYGEARTFCKTGELDPKFESDTDQPVIDEIAHLVKLLNLQPSCALRYDRQPFNGHPYYDPSLRITFDTNCRARIHDLDLCSSTLEEMKFFLAPQLSILEVKADDRVPYWLVQKLHQHKFMLHKISKYCTALENLVVQLHRQVYVLPRPKPGTDDTQTPAASKSSERPTTSRTDPAEEQAGVKDKAKKKGKYDDLGTLSENGKRLDGHISDKDESVVAEVPNTGEADSHEEEASSGTNATVTQTQNDTRGINGSDT